MADNTELTQLRTDSVAIQIKVASLEFEKMASKALAPFGLTPSQYKVLKLVLSEPDNSIRQVDIEHLFSMTNPTVTGIIHNLEKNGLVKRVPNPNDARSKVIVPTRKALDLKERLLQVGCEIEEEFTQNLSEAERKRLLALIEKLLKNNA